MIDSSISDPSIKNPHLRKRKTAANPSAKPSEYGVIDEYSTADKLLIDIDLDKFNTPKACYRLTKTSNYFIETVIDVQIIPRLRMMQIPIKQFFYRKTKHGWHIKINLDSMYTPVELCAIQAICGSDANREALNFKRAFFLASEAAAVHLAERWQVLFVRKLGSKANGDWKQYKPDGHTLNQGPTASRTARPLFHGDFTER
jgi:hypothetical protein